MIRKEDVSDIQPLTPMQEGMLFHHLLGDVPTAYHERLRIRFAEADIPRLLNAWEAVVRRYDALRRVFVADRVKTPVQMVLREVCPDMAAEDLSGLPGSEREKVLEERVSQLQTGPFVMAEAPPVYLRLFDLGDSGCEMVLGFHHILLDGWSLGLILDDLFASYRGEGAALAPAPDMRHYHHWRSRRDDAAAKAYWNSRLEGWEGSAGLPFFSENTTDRSFEPETASLRLTAEETAAVKALAARLELTLSALMEGIWRLLLYRYTNSRDTLFGRVSAGRPPEVPEMERMAGLFIQTLPVRVPVDGGKPFADLCRDLLEDAFQAKEYSHLSLAEVGGGSRLFSHILIFENFPSPGSPEALEAASGLRLQSAAFSEHSGYDLEVVIHPEPVLDIAFRYNAARLEAAAVQRMAGHFEQALKSVLENPRQTVGSIQILDARQRQAAVPPLPVLPEAPLSLTQRLVRVAEAQPEKPLVTCGDQVLTAAAIMDLARQVAAGLADLGIRPGDGVGIALKRSEQLSAAIFGVLFSGAFWVPMDPTHPESRNAAIRENSRCRCVVGDENGPRVVSFASLLGKGHAPVREWDGQSVAYRIYTSGSTGRPKGVNVSRENLAVFAENLGSRFGFGTEDTILARTTVTFDISILEMVVAPACGVAVAMADDAACRDPEALMDIIHDRDVNLVQMTPSFAKLMLEVHDGGRCFPRNLRRFLVGGEPLPASMAKRLLALRQTCPDLVVYNVYGPTESTIWSTAWELAPGPVAVGRPLEGEAVYLLSEDGEPAPPGGVGEIVMAGRGVALGYHDLPETDAQKFRDNRFDRGRMYATGDLGVRRPDGELVCLGRVDDQIKIRGNRIEPEEVAAVFLQHPGVRDAVVDAVARDGEKRLCCWVVPAGGALPEDLREYGRVRLPDAMVPDLFLAIDAIPLSPSGKADKKRLPLPEPVETEAGNDLLDPREIRLAAIWREVLGTTPQSGSTSFFATGGHSLKAIQLVSRIRKHLGVTVSIQDVFSAPTLGEQARLLAQRESGAKDAFLAAPDHTACPLSPGQLRMWLVENRGAHPGAYNTVGLFRIEGRPDPRAFEETMALMVARHESLRTVYGLEGGRPCQRIADPFPVTITPETVPLSPDMADESAALKALADTEAALAFDLAEGPLFRIRWIGLPSADDNERAAVILTFHHIASDGWSDGILAREINTAYAAFASGGTPDLPPLSLRYRDYAATLNRWLSGPDASAYRDFWRQRLDGIEPIELPLDYLRPPVRQNRGGRHLLEAAPGLGTQLEKGAETFGLSLFQLLLGATALLLYHRSGQTDVVIGTPSAGRWHEDIEPLVGFFLNMVPIRVRFEDDATGGELLRAAARAALESLAMERYPFERMVADAGLAEDPGRHPIFDVMLIVHNQRPARLDLAGCRVRELSIRQPGCRFDLDFEWHAADGGWGFLDYDADLFSPETAAGLGTDFINGALWLLENPETPILQFGAAAEDAFAAGAAAPLSEDF